MYNDAQNTHVSPIERQNLEHEVHEPHVAEHVSQKTGQDSENKAPDLPAAAEDSLAFFKRLAELSAIFVGFTFIGGWSYLTSYYSTFGLNALELDVPLPVVCTTAVYVLFGAWWPVVVVAGFGLGWIFFGRRLRRFQRSAMAIALVLLFLAVSIAGFFRGKRRATDDMLMDSSELPYVAFSSRLAKTDQPPCVDYQTYGSLDCKLLLHSKGTYYFFTPVPTPRDALTSGGNLDVYTLADSDVTGVHIQRGLERNARGK
jgi:hypothetical protein